MGLEKKITLNPSSLPLSFCRSAAKLLPFKASLPAAGQYFPVNRSAVMAGLKRKTREGKRDHKGRDSKKKNQRVSGGGSEGKDGRRKRVGPRLPNAMLKELQLPKRYADSDDEEIGSDNDAVNDLYEYEEEIAEEESRKNRRFDTVENYQYELPDEFEVLIFFLFANLSVNFFSAELIPLL